MSSTPRLRSDYPATPVTTNRRRPPPETPSINDPNPCSKSPSLPLAPENAPAYGVTNQPVISLTFIDAPQQRLYAFGLYTSLWAWKLYDWLQVIEGCEASWWLFFKWILIDFIFLFVLSELRIPWLELSQVIVTTAFTAHLILNYLLMFNIPLPWQSWLVGLVKILYDHEMSISEQSVKASKILNNHSLIMGKQIINILPEGSAVLNPEHAPYCLGTKSKATVALPIYFNATIPAEIEIVRIDLDTNMPEVMKLSSREVSKVARAIREQSSDPNPAGFNWQYQAKKPGIYRLGRVLDEYKLEVQKHTKDTYVVPCPRARVRTINSSQRCIHDLSDLSLDVVGTPPLRIKYRRSINGNSDGFHFQSLQPDGFISPLVQATSNNAADWDDDISWVRPSKITVSLNESMAVSGEWEYFVKEVHDAFGNVVEYTRPNCDFDYTALPKDLVHKFNVKERPNVRMKGCDLRRPIKAAKGQRAKLPISFGLSGDVADTSHELTWQFSPIDSLSNSGEHSEKASIGRYLAKNSRDEPRVLEPGLYTLKTVSSGSCEGVVDEPSSCLLLNPLEPRLSMRAEDIPDKCAGNSVGLRVDLDFVGTPPFTVRYQIITPDDAEDKVHHVSGLRSQLELIPRTAGRHRYILKSIDDTIYTGVLLGADQYLEQVVKPAASAKIVSPSSVINTCLDSDVRVDVGLCGDPPFSLEWETIYDGKRKTEKITDIEDGHFVIKTPVFTKGGEYILALSSVQDKRGCRIFLQDQLKISVRRQRPRAGFGLVEQKSSIMAVESDASLHLPLRLQGEAPWTVSYRNLYGNGEVFTRTATNANDHIAVKSRGIYEIFGVKDRQCPGNIDASASKFQVDWFPRPQISLVNTSSITAGAGMFVKKEVCEGDTDRFEVRLQGQFAWALGSSKTEAKQTITGSPPYHVQYEIKHQPFHGSHSSNRKSFDAVLPKADIPMDTSKAGDYTYKFLGLADNLYNSDKNFPPLVVQQLVNAKPSAAFAKPGKSFKYCVKEQEDEDKISILLTGVAPFSVEVEIKHQASSTPETHWISSIDSKSYAMSIPRQYLRLGTQQLRIRRVRDARGCQQKYEMSIPSIQIQLFDAPSIYPLESREDFCVGERIGYTLSGTPPFDISYEFNGRWNAKEPTTSFRRIAEKPGEFTITSITDKASDCRAAINLHKTIHALPSVQISRGKQSRIDIHEGNEVDILFEFWGTPPFEFTYTRSTNAKKGQRSVVLETRHDVSYEHSKIVKASQEGTYEVVAIKDRFCSFSTQQVDKREGGQ